MNKKDAYYFSHDSNARHDPKILNLRKIFGNEGYALYFMTIEVMREQKTFEIDKKMIDFISTDLALECEKYKKFIDYCVKIDLFTKENGKIFSKSLKNRMELYQSKSNKARESALKRWQYSQKEECERNANALPTQCEGNALKESKGNERKRNIDIIDFHSFWLSKIKKDTSEFWKTPTREQAILARLMDGRTLEELKLAAENYLSDEWEGRKQFAGWERYEEYLLKTPEMLESWLNKKKKLTFAERMELKERGEL